VVAGGIEPVHEWQLFGHEAHGVNQPDVPGPKYWTTAFRIGSPPSVARSNSGMSAPVILTDCLVGNKIAGRSI
jgi:hypothetical protein